MGKWIDPSKWIPAIGAAFGYCNYIVLTKRDSSTNNGLSMGYLRRIICIQNVSAAGLEQRAPLKLIPTNNPHIPFTTSEGKVKLAEYIIPPSGIKNFYIAIDGSRYMNPNYTVAISKLPDDMQIHLDYKDIKDVPITLAYNQSYPCTQKDEKNGRLSIQMPTDLRDLGKLRIKTLGAYVDHCVKREGDDNPRPFKGEGHYAELHDKMCNLKKGKKRLYPEGQECSFAYDNKKNDFFLRNIPDLFYPIRMRDQVMPGVSGPYVYVGGEGASFPIHEEDARLFSLNYMPIVKDLPGQGEKLWVSFHVDDQDLAIKFFKDEYPKLKPGDLTKTLYLRDLHLLAAKGIRFQLIRQTPGTMIWTNGLHAGLNTGIVVTEALNAATIEWIGKYHRFPKDKRLVKPKQSQINLIQTTKDFSKGRKIKRFVDGKQTEDSETGAPLYKEQQLLGKMLMVSQILLHKFYNHFEKDPITQMMSPIEKRLFIESVVGAEQKGLDFFSDETWMQVRKYMYVLPEGKSNCAKSLDGYLKGKGGIVYSDIPQTNEPTEKSKDFAKHMTELRRSGWIRDLISSLHSNWRSDYIEQDFHKALAEQRASDPPGTWPNKFAETEYGKKTRGFSFELAEGERFPSKDEGFESGNESEQEGFQEDQSETSSSSQSRSTYQQGGLTESGTNEPPSTPHSQSNVQEESLNQTVSNEDTNTPPPQPLIQEKELYQSNFPLSPSSSQDQSLQIGDTLSGESAQSQPQAREDIREALNRSISLISQNGALFGSIFEGKSESERAGFLLTIRGSIRNEELILFTDDKGEISTQRSLEGISQEVRGDDVNSERIGVSQSSVQYGSVIESDANQNPKVAEVSISANTKTPCADIKKISRKRKITVKLSKKELGSTSNKLYISILMDHFKFEVKTPAPLHHLNSQSGFFYEIVTGKTKLILKDPIKIANLLKTLATKIGSDEEFDPKDLVGFRTVSLAIWERLLMDSGYTTQEAERLANVIYQSLMGSSKFKSIEYRRLDFVLRTYINSLSKAANKGVILMSKNQEEWLKGEDDKLAEIGAPMKFNSSNMPFFKDAEEDKEWDEISSWIKENWLHLISIESDMERMDEEEFATEEFLQAEAKERIALKADH